MDDLKAQVTNHAGPLEVPPGAALSAEQREIFEWAAGALRATLQPVDGVMLVELAVSVCELRAIRKTLSRDGHCLRDAAGRPKKHPLLMVSKQIQARLSELSRDLGLSAPLRARLGLASASTPSHPAVLEQIPGEDLDCLVLTLTTARDHAAERGLAVAADHLTRHASHYLAERLRRQDPEAAAAERAELEAAEEPPELREVEGGWAAEREK